jgi:hypothetical protein
MDEDSGSGSARGLPWYSWEYPMIFAKQGKTDDFGKTTILAK